MAEFRGDQASGLRRMFVRKEARIFSFMAGSAGVGRTLLVANVALALAQLGQQVLVIDENSGKDDIASAFSLLTRYDYLHVLQSQRRISEVVTPLASNLYLLPAARAVQRLGKVSEAHYEFLYGAIGQVGVPFDFVLIDAVLNPVLGFSRLGLESQENLIVLAGNSMSITEAYTLLKKVSQHPQMLFYTLINRVSHAGEAYRIHDNIAALVHQRGIAALSHVGAVPVDEAMRQSALLGSPVVSAFPASGAAYACRDLAVRMVQAVSPPVDGGAVATAVSGAYLPAAGDKALLPADRGQCSSFEFAATPRYSRITRTA